MSNILFTRFMLGDIVLKNRVIRLLLVVALANLGSMIGTIVAFPYIASFIT